MIVLNPLEAIGNTPLISLPFRSKGIICAKLEYLNPAGSVKDRVARYLITQAEQKNLLKPGGTIIDASSGNQGIAMAMIGSLKGYTVIISVSEKISKEKLKTIQAYGAQVIISPPTKFLEDPKSYHSVAVQLQKQIENSYMPNQYFNPENATAHYASLGPEIWHQTQGKITHFFAGTGTGGTITGVGRFLKEQNPNVKVIAIDSACSFRATNGNPKPYDIEGVGIDFDSPVIDYSVIDEIITVTDEHTFEMLKFLSGKNGLLVGPSSGAVAYVSQQYASKLGKDDLAVIIFGDSGRAYLSKNFYAQSKQNINTTASTKEKSVIL